MKVLEALPEHPTCPFMLIVGQNDTVAFHLPLYRAVPRPLCGIAW